MARLLSCNSKNADLIKIMRKAKISIITVCFNSEQTIKGTLESIKNQDYNNIEFIIIDGGSGDGTLKVIENSGVSVAKLISEPDGGIYDAMNKGLRIVSGDIVGFLNADDQYATHSVLSQVVKKFEEEKLDAVLGDVAYFHKSNPGRIVRRYRSDGFSPARLAWGWMPAHPALFLSRSVIQRVGYFKSEYRIAGDFDYIARAFYGGNLKYYYIPEILVRMQDGGVSTAGWRSKFLLNKEVLQSCRENGISTNLFKILSKYPFKIREIFER